MMDNKLIALLSQGLSWRDSLSSEEQARLISSGRPEKWLAEIKSIAKSIGIERTLKQITYSLQEIETWGAHQSAIFSLLGVSELYGLSCELGELLEQVADTQPKSWRKVKTIARSLIKECLRKQVEDGDVYLFRPSVIKTADFAVFVPRIIERRSSKMEQIKPYIMDDGLVDMFDFLDLPIAMDVMIKSGIGGRAKVEDVTAVLDTLVEANIIDSTNLSEKRKKGTISSSVEERYHRLFSGCQPQHRDLLRGCAMCLDPDESIIKKGLELIYKTGHIHCKEPLLFALRSQDTEILTNAIKGLGIIGDKESIPAIGKFLSHSSNQVMAAACISMGQLGATDYIDEIGELTKSNDDDVTISAMKALLLIDSAKATAIFWPQVERLGMGKISQLSKEIGESKSELAGLFMFNLLMLDLQAFMQTREIGLYNDMVRSKSENEINLRNLLIKKLREQAVWGFGRLGDRGVPVLISLLQIFPETQKLSWEQVQWEPSERKIEMHIKRRVQEQSRFPSVREVIPVPIIDAVRSLGMTHSEKAVPYLRRLSKSDDEEIVLQVIEALGEIDTPAIDALLEVPELTPKVRMKKITEIGTFVHPKAIEWLLIQVEDKDPLIRLTAGNYLVLRNDSAFSAVLKKLATDENRGVRAGIANTILRLGFDSYPEIIEILSNDGDKLVREIIVKARLTFETNKEGDFWA
ncbi:MAG: HEAT repeat domain-containing protein [Candidatus Thorarchaeota archaeon]